jgi:hypothetical protein
MYNLYSVTKGQQAIRELAVLLLACIVGVGLP